MTWFCPRPPHSLGSRSPRKPSAASASSEMRGNVSVASFSAARGRISASQISISRSRSAFCSSVRHQSGSKSSRSRPFMCDSVTAAMGFAFASSCCLSGKKNVLAVLAGRIDLLEPWKLEAHLQHEPVGLAGVEPGELLDAPQALAQRVGMNVERLRRGADVAALAQELLERLQELRVAPPVV